MSDCPVEIIRWSCAAGDEPVGLGVAIAEKLERGFVIVSAYAVQHPSYTTFVHFVIMERRAAVAPEMSNEERENMLAELAGGKGSKIVKGKVR